MLEGCCSPDSVPFWRSSVETRWDALKIPLPLCCTWKLPTSSVFLRTGAVGLDTTSKVRLLERRRGQTPFAPHTSALQDKVFKSNCVRVSPPFEFKWPCGPFSSPPPPLKTILWPPLWKLWPNKCPCSHHHHHTQIPTTLRWAKQCCVAITHHHSPVMDMKEWWWPSRCQMAEICRQLHCWRKACVQLSLSVPLTETTQRKHCSYLVHTNTGDGYRQSGQHEQKLWGDNVPQSWTFPEV